MFNYIQLTLGFDDLPLFRPDIAILGAYHRLNRSHVSLSWDDSGCHQNRHQRIVIHMYNQFSMPYNQFYPTIKNITPVFTVVVGSNVSNKLVYSVLL